MSDQLLHHVPGLDTDLVVERPAGRLAVEHEYARRSHQPLTSVMIGRHWRFYGRDVEAWLTYLR